MELLSKWWLCSSLPFSDIRLACSRAPLFLSMFTTNFLLRERTMGGATTERKESNISFRVIEIEEVFTACDSHRDNRELDPYLSFYFSISE